MAAVDPHALRRCELSEVAKLTIRSRPETPTFPHSGYVHYIHSIPVAARRSSYAVRFGSSDLDIAAAAGTPVYVTMCCTAFYFYLKCAPQMLQSASVWIPDPASIQTQPLFETRPLLKIPCSDPWLLFEPGFYTDIYGMLLFNTGKVK